MSEDTLAAAVARLVALAPAYFRYSPDWALMVYFPKYTEEYEKPLNWFLCGRVSSYTPQHDPPAWALLHAGLLRLVAAEFVGYSLGMSKQEDGPPLYTAEIRTAPPPWGIMRRAPALDPTTALLFVVLLVLEARNKADAPPTP